MSRSSKETDSRDYIVPFRISGEADLPSDFALPPEMPREFSGIFLPQDRTAFARRRPPPCLLLLAGPSIWIVTRDGGHTAIPLASLQILECARMLLLGWIGLEWDGGSETVRYNRRSAPIVEEFLRKLKMSWLRGALTAAGPQAFGAGPNAKFRHVSSTELLPDEAPLLQFFQPPLRQSWRTLGIRRETHKAGDLLMLSDRRLLWITDRRQSAQDRYGTVARSAALAALNEVRTNSGDGGTTIGIGLGSGTLWNIPVAGEWEDEAKAFVEMAGRIL